MLGSEILDQATHQFRIHKGPVFTNLLLADEVNRATPKTQSALLEAMGEGQVTVATGKGSLGLVVVQAEGRAPVDASAFARGQRALDGTILGE